jgi:hypothetical protein
MCRWTSSRFDPRKRAASSSMVPGWRSTVLLSEAICSSAVCGHCFVPTFGPAAFATAASEIEAGPGHTPQRISDRWGDVMIPTTSTPRSFLSASAMLAAGTVVLPRSARAAVTLPPASGESDAAARIRATLRTPRNYLEGRHCAACGAVRARPYRCEDCGYSGPPATFACDCARQVDEQEFSNTFTMATRATSHWPAEWATPRAELASETRKLRRLIRQGAVPSLSRPRQGPVRRTQGRLPVRGQLLPHGYHVPCIRRDR